MRITMVMIQTVLHFVTSVSSSTCGANDCNLTNDKLAVHEHVFCTNQVSVELDDGLALTTMALATDGATKPGIEPMQLVSPRSVPSMRTILYMTRLFRIKVSTLSAIEDMHLQNWGQCPEGW